MTGSLVKRVSTILFLIALPLWLVGYAVAIPPVTATDPSVQGMTNSNRVFMPLINRGLGPQSVFGVEISQGAVAAIGQRVSDAAVAWTRYNGVVWSEIEPQRGAPNFSKLAAVDAELAALAQQGTRPIVIVRGTPSWAQQVPGSACGPIRADAHGDFARFMRQIVARYSGPPYNIRHWELGNEPDVESHVGSEVYGCWGNKNDRFYGGGNYGDMLKVVYPAIKQADPSAQVVLGGLLLDCDPARGGERCKSAHFLEGVLQSGAGNAFDIVGYHAYAFWSRTVHDWELNHVHWNHAGGSLVGKLNFIRRVLAQYNVNKPIMMNEGGLLCAEWEVCDESTRAAQANYVVRLYSRSWANDLLASIWYTLDGPGWREAGLLDRNQQPRPAYTTLQFMARKLAGGSYIGALSTNGYEGYAFRNGAKTYRVYWTNDASTVPVALPAGVVYNMYGQAIPAPTTVGFEPIFVESDS